MTSHGDTPGGRPTQDSSAQDRRRSADRMARRIWRMEQEAIRFSLRELGIPVVHWDGEQSLDLPLAGHTRRPLAARR